MRLSALRKLDQRRRETEKLYVRLKDVVRDPRVCRAHVDNRVAVARGRAHDNHVARDGIGACVWVQCLAAFHEDAKARQFLAVIKLHVEVVYPRLMGGVGEDGFDERVA